MTVSKLPELHARLKIQINNLVDLSTVAAKQNSNRSWVKIHSALWGSIQSALTNRPHQHIGHASANGGGHFSLKIVSQQFFGKSIVARHRMIYSALAEMMKCDIHALNIQVQSPDEV